MRFLRIFAAGLLSAGAIFGLFVAFCILPKVNQAEHDQHTLLPGWISIPASMVNDWMLNSIYCLCALLLAAFLIALLPFVASSVHRAATAILYALAFGASACAIYLLTIAAAGMIYANSDLNSKNHVYASALDHFSLLESANGRFDQLQALNAKLMSGRLIEIADATTLTRDQREEQIRALIYGMKTSKDVAFLKQMLATSDEFRVDIVKDAFAPKMILQAASVCGAPSDDINKFYDWLEPRIGTDGWNKVPLHVMVFDK